MNKNERIEALECELEGTIEALSERDDQLMVLGTENASLRSKVELLTLVIEETDSK